MSDDLGLRLLEEELFEVVVEILGGGEVCGEALVFVELGFVVIAKVEVEMTGGEVGFAESAAYAFGHFAEDGEELLSIRSAMVEDVLVAYGFGACGFFVDVVAVEFEVPVVAVDGAEDLFLEEAGMGFHEGKWIGNAPHAESGGVGGADAGEVLEC